MRLMQRRSRLVVLTFAGRVPFDFDPTIFGDPSFLSSPSQKERPLKPPLRYHPILGSLPNSSPISAFVFLPLEATGNGTSSDITQCGHTLNYTGFVFLVPASCTVNLNDLQELPVTPLSIGFLHLENAPTCVYRLLDADMVADWTTHLCPLHAAAET